MADTLEIFGDEFTNVTGIKATDDNNQIKTYIRPQGTVNITQVGVTDVTNYATATVPYAQHLERVLIEDTLGGISVDSNGALYANANGTETVSYFTNDGWAFANEGVIVSYGFESTGQLSTQSATTITPTESSQTAVTAGKYTTGAVTVSAIPSNYVGSGITQRSSSDLTVSGATVTAPSGYYSASASKSVASGTAGTPTATKGTVSNHSVSVTPSVTNTTGYITGSTKTGTAVTVSASELVSGSETKTENGTYDVTNLASLVVDVPSSSGGMKLGYSTATPENVNKIVFTGIKGAPTSLCITSDANISTNAVPNISTILFDGTVFEGIGIGTESNAQVSPLSSGAFVPIYDDGDQTITINTSGCQFVAANSYSLVYTYGGSASNIGTKEVQVGSGATSITFTGLEAEPDYFSCVFESSFGTSSGYQRVITIVNDGSETYGLAMDSTAKAQTSWTYSYSNGSLTITSQGTNNGGYFHQPGNYQLTYGYGGEVPHYQSKTVTPTTSVQNVTADAGYEALSKVTVDAIPSQYIIPTGNYPITQNGNNINIAQYETVSVNVSGGGSLTVATKTTTLNATSQTLSFSSLSGEPKYWFLRATTNVSSSGSTTYYYVTDCFYDGTSIKGNTFRIGSTRRVQNITSGITQSYSGGTLTITAGSSSGATPGQFYGASNFGYELVYVY